MLRCMHRAAGNLPQALAEVFVEAAYRRNLWRRTVTEPVQPERGGRDRRSGGALHRAGGQPAGPSQCTADPCAGRGPWRACWRTRARLTRLAVASLLHMPSYGAGGMGDRGHRAGAQAHLPALCRTPLPPPVPAWFAPAALPRRQCAARARCGTQVPEGFCQGLYQGAPSWPDAARMMQQGRPWAGWLDWAVRVRVHAD